MAILGFHRGLLASPVTVTVPGTSDPWLAGMPNGSMASRNPEEVIGVVDGAPGQSPVEVVGVTLRAGLVLNFRALGGVRHAPELPLAPPDGSSTAIAQHLAGSENGLSNVSAPYDSLLGVFLGSTSPSGSAAPGPLDFSQQFQRDYVRLAPQLRQIFFIGDGFTTQGAIGRVLVPDGATRLFLGTMDSHGWGNNGGEFQVIISTEPSAPRVAMVSPVSETRITEGADLTMAAEVSDPDGFIRRVAFFADDERIGLATNAPYNLVWRHVLPGSYALSARALDNDGLMSTSAPVRITVDPGCFRMPPGLVASWTADGTGDGVMRPDSQEGVLRREAPGRLDGCGLVPGKVGQAFRFDGVDDSVVSTGEPPAVSNTFTVEFWVWPDKSRTLTPEAANGVMTLTGQRMALNADNVATMGVGTVGVSVGTNGISVFERTVSSVTSPLVYSNAITGWTHLAVVYQDRQPSLFVNGIGVRTGLASPRTAVLPSTSLSRSGVGAFSGMVDEMDIYDRALTAAEIKALVKADSMPRCDAPRTSCLSNGDFETGDLSGWYRTGENGGSGFLAKEGICFSVNNSSGIALSGQNAGYVRSSGAAPVDSIGTLISRPFLAGGGLTFSALSENSDLHRASRPVVFTARLLDLADQVLLTTNIQTGVVTLSPNNCLPVNRRNGRFTSHVVDTAAFRGLPIRLEFDQHTTVPGEGHFTLVDDVEVMDPFGPRLVRQPADVIVLETEPVDFHALADERTPAVYQWRLNGQAIRGATNAWWHLAAASNSVQGVVDVVIGNCAGTVTSRGARLAVEAASLPRVVRLPPLVVLSAPLNGNELVAPAEVKLAASTRDPDGSIVRVEFFQGPTKLGEARAEPYQMTWSHVVSGEYILTARATADSGLVATSAPVQIRVTAPPNQPPSVTLTSPPHRSIFPGGSDVAMSASATDPDGMISRVEFWVGTALLGVSVVPPHRFVWRDVPVGDYVLTAQAIDNDGLTTTSVPVAVVVSQSSGDVAIVRVTDDPEVGVLQDYLLEMGLSSAIFDAANASPDFFQGFHLVVWAGLSETSSGLTPRTVDLFQQLFDQGLPLYFIGSNLVATASSWSESQRAHWHRLIHLKPGSGRTASGPITIPMAGDPHPIVQGGFGAIETFPYDGTIESAVLAEADAEVVGRAGSTDVLAAFPADRAADGPRTLTQNVPVTGGGPSGSLEIRKRLFQNAVCWLTRCRTCTAFHLNYELRGPEAGVSAGDTVTFTNLVRHSGECELTGVVVTNRLAIGARFVSANSVQGTWSYDAGSHSVVFHIGRMTSALQVETTWTMTATAEGSLRQVGTVQANGGRGASSAEVMMAVAGSTRPVLSAARLPGGQYELQLSGEAGRSYRIQGSTDLLIWVDLKRVVGPKAALTTPDLAPSSGGFLFFRAVSP